MGLSRRLFSGGLAGRIDFYKTRHARRVWGVAVQGWESIKLDIRVEFFGERSDGGVNF